MATWSAHRARGREYYSRPITAPPPKVSARFLSEHERVQIADLNRAGWSRRQAERAGIAFSKAGNCFTAVADPAGLARIADA